PFTQAPVHISAENLQVFALLFAIRSEESRAHIAFTCRTRWLFPKTVVEASEVRQVWHVVHQCLHSRGEVLSCVSAAFGQGGLYLLREFDEHADEVGGIAARIVD